MAHADRAATRGSAATAPEPDWPVRLRADGPDRDSALAELHTLLLGAARFEIGRRREQLPGMGRDELEDLAVQAADDALAAILRKLDSFRGESRFTTWAYKFALLEAAVTVRRRAWRHREVTLHEDAWPLIADRSPGPEATTEVKQEVDAIRRAMLSELTAHQRQILLAVAVEGVPIDVLAERLATTRGALYKTIHDARRKLRASLIADGQHDGEGGR